MRRLTLALAVCAGAVSTITPGAAAAEPKLHECQKPVRTGVEVYGLKGVSSARACGLALALFSWENAGHWEVLYGCRRPSPDAPGRPYLKLHRFHGWALSLRGRPFGEFRMSRERSSFFVTGTDFPLNCT
jgi:hypothetical protein